MQRWTPVQAGDGADGLDQAVGCRAQGQSQALSVAGQAETAPLDGERVELFAPTMLLGYDKFTVLYTLISIDDTTMLFLEKKHDVTWNVEHHFDGITSIEPIS